MTIIRSLAEVATALEDTVKGLPVQATNPAELYDFYEEVAIQILDSNANSYTPGALEAYLHAFLAQKRQLLGLTEFPHSGEK